MCKVQRALTRLLGLAEAVPMTVLSMSRTGIDRFIFCGIYEQNVFEQA
jgi:hypothetical protein